MNVLSISSSIPSKILLYGASFNAPRSRVNLFLMHNRGSAILLYIFVQLGVAFIGQDGSAKIAIWINVGQN